MRYACWKYSTRRFPKFLFRATGRTVLGWKVLNCVGWRRSDGRWEVRVPLVKHDRLAFTGDGIEDRVARERFRQVVGRLLFYPRMGILDAVRVAWLLAGGWQMTPREIFGEDQPCV